MIIRKFFTRAFAVGALLGVVPINTSLFAIGDQQQLAVVAAPSTSEGALVPSEQDQAEILKKIDEIRALATEVEAHKKLQEVLSTLNNSHRPFSEQLGKALTDGVGDGVEFVKTVTAGSMRFLIKIGVAVVIIGFTGTLAYRVVVSRGPVDLGKLGAQGTWYLLKMGGGVAKYVAELCGGGKNQ